MSDDPTDGHRIYAVGDIHGRNDLLTEMIARIRRDLATRPHPRPLLIFLGDYVDRGPDSRGVIETLIGLKEGDLPTAFLLGNHDRYVQAYLRDPEWYDLTYHWLADNLGGARTLASYGVEDANPARPGLAREPFAAAFPDSHRAFLDSAALWVRRGSYVFAHAGIRPGIALDEQDPEDLDLDPRALPQRNRGLRLQGRPRAHDRPGRRTSFEPHRRRHRRLPDRGALVRRPGGSAGLAARARRPQALAGRVGPRRMAEPLAAEVS